MDLEQTREKYFSPWRLGQLIVNFQQWVARKKKIDLFYVEDEQFNAYFKEFIECYGKEVR